MRDFKITIDMAKNEIRVRCPQGWPPNDWYNFNVKLMKVLQEKHGIVDDDEVCNLCFDEFLNDREIADIAVFVFGNDLPATCEQVRALVLKGVGDCPVCGSNARQEITGAYEAAHEGEFGGCPTLGWRCLNCKYEDYADV